MINYIVLGNSDLNFSLVQIKLVEFMTQNKPNANKNSQVCMKNTPKD